MRRALFSHRRPRDARGFTLIELLVVMAIIMIMSGLVVASQSQLRTKIRLRNLAYDMALAIREAQILGINVSQINPGAFGASYGVAFDFGTPGSFVIFADCTSQSCDGENEGDGEWGGAYDRVLETFSLAGGYAVSALCASAGVTTHCSPSPLTDLAITFRRPDPDAVITSNIGTAYTDATITVRAPNGDVRFIEVGVTGQVSVTQP